MSRRLEAMLTRLVRSSRHVPAYSEPTLDRNYEGMVVTCSCTWSAAVGVCPPRKYEVRRAAARAFARHVTEKNGAPS